MTDEPTRKRAIDGALNRTRVMLVITAAMERVGAHSELDGVDAGRSFRSLATGRDLREWTADLGDAPTAHAALVAAYQSIRSRQAAIDEAIGVIRHQDEETTVCLVLWQDIDDSPGVAGFELPAGLVAWLATHGGSVTVDQVIEGPA